MDIFIWPVRVTLKRTSAILHFRYQTYDTMGSAASTITLGPISFTTHELFTSFMSSLIVLPPVILITVMFVKATPKHQQMTTPTGDNSPQPLNKSCNLEARGGIHSEGTAPREHPHQKMRPWPYWCKYIAWSMTALTIASAAFFTLLYSFEFGGDKSRAWLIAFFLAFVESVMLLQPVKVIWFHLRHRRQPSC